MKVSIIQQTKSRARESQARAEIGALLIGEAGRITDLAQKRDRLELARAQLRKSLDRLEADLEKLPS